MLKTNTATAFKKNFYKHIQLRFLFLFQLDVFSAMQGVVLVSQRLMLLEESFPLRRAEWGFLLNLLPYPSRQPLSVKREYQCPV